jgi:RNA polymerase sigma factor (sigma-70 family)
MGRHVKTLTLDVDIPISESLTRTQGWVLSAMQLYGPQLVGMLWRILGSEADVCDAYQQTFLNLAHCLNGQKPENIKAYVFRTASNIASSMLRRKIVERKNLPKLPEKADPEQTEADIDTSLLRLQLRNSISKLPDILREVIILHDLAELPYSKVAKIIGITEATARVYRCKALHLLAVLMNR